MTAQDIIKASLRVLKVIATGETPANDILVDGLEAMNQRLQTWRAEGFNVRTYTSLTQTVSMSDGYINALKWRLAIDLAPEFDAEVPPLVVAQAAAAEKLMIRQKEALLVVTATIQAPTTNNSSYDIDEG